MTATSLPDSEANDFNFGYSTITGADIKPNKSIGSNVVEVTIAPTKVMVGGDVWIDANSDGFYILRKTYED